MFDIIVLEQINDICRFLIDEVPDQYQFESSMVLGFETITGVEIRKLNKKKLFSIIENNEKIIEEYKRPFKEAAEKKYNLIKNKIRQLNDEVSDKYHTELMLQYIEQIEKGKAGDTE